MMSFTSFSQPKQGWLKRNWHNMNARYNGYFHSLEILNSSIRTLEEAHVDNFNSVITLYPYGTLDQASSISGEMDEIFKKTSKVIKKHPKSKWVDDCYMLIGQSYFLKGDPYAAIELFQYVAKQFPDGPLKYDAKVWILKSYLRQDKINDAEAIMGLIRQDADVPNRLEKDLNVVAAEIYIRQRKYAQAAKYLTKALAQSKDRNERYRFNFALGQLNLELNQADKAKNHFVKTIKLNPPYTFAFQSNLGLIRTIGYEESGSLKTPKKYLKKMLKDDKNLEYFDQIYYELAKLEMQENNKQEAIRYYQLSAQKSTKNKDQKATSYLALAKMFFEDRSFEKSQKYFDSTVMFIGENHPEYEKIKAQHSVLTTLIDNLVTVYEQDSLLAFANLPKADQERRIKDQIGREKEAEEKAKRDASVEEVQDMFNNPTKTKGNQSVGGEWYFYNPSAIARGNNEFIRKWGQRPHTDVWRLRSVFEMAGQSQNQDPQDQDSSDTPGSPVGDLTYDAGSDADKQKFLEDIDAQMRKYFKDVPISEAAKEASLSKIETALFNIAKIYQYDLKELNLAIENYLKHRSRFENSVYTPEIIFNLYKCAQALGNESDEKAYAKELDDKFPDSKFNAVVNNKEVVEDIGEEKEVIILYEKAYTAYKKEKYTEVIAIKDKALSQYPGNSLQAKFDYLYALSIGKTKGVEDYLKLLEGIVDNYPGTTVANEAKNTIAYFVQKQKDEQPISESTGSAFTYKSNTKHYFICVLEGGELSEIKVAFSNHNKEKYRLKNLRVGDYTLGNKTVVAIQHFENKADVEKYYVEFLKNAQFYQDLNLLAFENFMISDENFKILLKAGDTDSYSRFFVENYIQ